MRPTGASLLQTRLLAVLVTAIALSILSLPAARADLPEGPYLRIEMGMHVAPIRDLAFDPASGVFATTSDDKTVRLWSTGNGDLLETIRVPMDLDAEGTIYTAAYWPDGKYLLMSGITGAAYINSANEPERNYLYVLPRANGYERILKKAPGGIVRKIALSPAADPKATRIAIAHSQNPRGIQVLAANLKTVFREDFGGAANWVEFAPDGRLAAASASGAIYLYTADFSRKLVWQTPGGQPSQVRFSPDGHTLAVGYADRPGFDLLDTGSLTRVGGYAMERAPYATLEALAWDEAGGLWAGGTLLAEGRPDMIVRHWPDPSQPDRFSDVSVGTDAVTALERGPDGAIFFATADPAIGKIDPVSLRILFDRRSPKPDYREVSRRRFSTNADGSIVTFAAGDRYRGETLVFNGRDLSLGRSLPGERMSDARPPAGLTGWNSQQSPALNGRPLRIQAGEFNRSATELADGRFALGGDYAIRLYHRDGRLLAEKPIATAAFGLVASSDGTRLIAAHGDGTIRWYELRQGALLEEVAALFVDIASRQWILWSPDGYFTHAESGGQNLAGFSLNRGFGQPARWIEFSQLYRERHRQILMKSRVGRLAQAAPPAPGGASGLGSVIHQAPEIKITQVCALDDRANDQNCWDANQVRRALRRRKSDSAPAAGAEVETFTLPHAAERVALHFTIAAAPADIKSIDVFRNGQTTGQTRALRRKPAANARSEPDGGTMTGRRVLQLHPGANTLYVRGYRHDGVYGKSQTIDLVREPPPEPQRPTLHLLAVGVDRYTGEGIPRLAFAGADARSIITHVQRAIPQEHYADANITLLQDETGTRQNITAALDRIAADAKPEDSVLVYIAGHGVIDPQTSLYYFVQSDVPAWDRIAETAVSQEDLVAMIGSVPARNVMLMLDTCHSGAFPAEAASNIGNETGYYVLAASSSTQEALDGYDGSNGVFAAAVLRGLNGEAPYYEDVIDAVDLGNYVRNTLPKMAKEKGASQTAQFRSSGGEISAFPLAEAMQ